MKNLLIIFICIAYVSCIKCKPPIRDVCAESKATLTTVQDWNGKIVYNNQVGKWAILVPITGTIDGFRNCIVCGNLPAQYQKEGMQVSFSGNLSDNNDFPKPTMGGEEVYYVAITAIR